MVALQTFRFLNHLSQQDLADYLGISKGQISRIEAGKSNLKDEYLSKIIANDKGWNVEMLSELSPLFELLEKNGVNKVAEDPELIRLKTENQLLREQLNRALAIIETFAGQKK